MTTATPQKLRTPKSPSFRVVVTETLIEHSKVRDSSHCMISEAVRDAYPDAKSISTDLQTIRFSVPARRLRFTYLTPRVAQLALINFDQGKLPKPFEFRLSKAHITSMYRRKVTHTPRGPLTPALQAALVKARSVNPSHQAHAAGVVSKRKQAQLDAAARREAQAETLKLGRLVPRNKNHAVPERVGGLPPPVTSFARRRAFGLRALEH